MDQHKVITAAQSEKYNHPYAAFAGLMLALLMSLSLVQRAWGEEVSVRNTGAEIDRLQQEQALVRKELSEIKAMLKALVPEQKMAPAAPKKSGPELPVTLSIGNSPSMGDNDASVVVLEFTDFQCPFCRRHALTAQRQLEKEYVTTGKIRYVLRNFPIQRRHPYAVRAAEAALCASEQGYYWEMKRAVFDNQKMLAFSYLQNYAQGLGIEMNIFRKCMSDRTYTAQIEKDLQDGYYAGVRGTPSFFIGRIDPEDPDSIIASRYLHGALPYKEIKRVIDELMQQGDT